MMCQFVGGRLNGQILSVEAVIRWHCNGNFTEDLSEIRERGGYVHRVELDNKPRVDGYLGPMWDGGMLRYETQEVYDTLSR